MQTALAQTACTRCRGAIEQDDLRCAICGLVAPLQQKAALAVVKAKIVRCDACGAAVSWDADAAAPKCAFCASVMKVETPTDPIEQAEATLPFTVNPQQAHDALQTWLKTRGFFTPSDLAKESTLDSMKPVFWPAWIFNARALVSWAADSDAGSGRSAWAPHAGQTTLDFDNLLVPASRGLTVKECDELATAFNLGSARPSPEGPADALVEPFEIARSGARKLIMDAVERHATARVQKGEIPGSKFRKVKTTALLSGLTTRRYSMPTYILAYRYQNKLYRVLVHGQDSSRLVGKSPLSWWKIAAVAGGVLLVVGAIIAALALKGGR